MGTRTCGLCSNEAFSALVIYLTRKMFRLVLASVVLCASAFALDFGFWPEEKDAGKECSLAWDPAKVIGTYQGRLLLHSMEGTLKGCTIDHSILKKAELGYVKAVDSFLKKVIPGGKCHPDTYAGVVYEAFAKAATAPKDVSDAELHFITQWCGGNAPTAEQLDDIATLKRALNLYGGDMLIKLVKCQC